MSITLFDIAKTLDHSTLQPFLTENDIIKGCDIALEYNTATVCARPGDMPLVVRRLSGSGVLPCTVIGFPLGQNTTAVKVAEVAEAFRDGCDEFDMVINVGRLKDGDLSYVREDIAAVVTAARGKTVKVIIETGLLTDEEKALATRLSCEAGAHFVKTCTGVSAGVATVSDIKIMKENITPGVRLKASAGIRCYADAAALVEAGADRLGTSAGVAIVTGAPAGKDGY